MKLKYPSPILFEVRELELDKIKNYNKAKYLLAVSEKKNLIVVRDLLHTSIWKNCWRSIKGGTSYNKIYIKKDGDEDPSIVSHVSKNIIEGIKYTIANNALLMGVLNISDNVFHERFLKSGFFSKRKNRPFLDMQSNFRSKEIYPKFKDSSIPIGFMGKGEKFLNLDFPVKQLAQIIKRFKGFLSGIICIEKETKELKFVILGQNIAKDTENDEMKFDENGRDTLWRLEKEGKIIPIGGFRLDYGLHSLKGLKQFESLTLLPKFSKKYQLYQEYHNNIMREKEISYKIEGEVSILNDDYTVSKPEKPKKKTLDVEELLAKKEKKKGESQEEISEKKPKTLLEELSPAKTKSTEEKAKESKIEGSILEKKKPKISQGKSLEKPKLPNSKIGMQKTKPPKGNLDLQKPSLPSKSGTKGSKIQESEVMEEDYEDIFKKKEKEEIFDKKGKAIINEKQLEQSLPGASKTIDQDLGKSIDPSLMNEQEIFQDLENSLDALSELDKISSKDEAISRIYYPPPTLISYAEKEGMEIGGSTTILSMGTGRNIYMIPELRRMRMYGKFYKEKDLHDQIEDFVAMDEKDIETPEEFENILHKAFINIKKNNRIFLGVIQIEANGFESDPGFGYTLEQNKMQKLMKIHTKRRDKIEFPRLTEESYIEVRYYGKPEVIQFLANQRKQGILEIAEQVQSDKKYSEAVMGGIICTDFEAVYFYILVNNFDNLDSENFESKIDETTYERMVEMIEKAKLTPVSWFRIDFGFQGFDNLFLWEEVKDSIIIETVQEKYQYYLGKLLKTKQREDDIKKRVEQQYDGIADVFSLVNKLEEKSKKEGKLICEKCGEDLPQDSDFCPSCGNQL